MSSYSDYSHAAAEIIQHQGDIQADAARRKGAMWGGTLASLGQLPQQFMAQRQHEKEFQARQQNQQQESQLKQQEIDLRRRALEAKDDPAVAEKRQLEAAQTRHELASRLLIGANADNWEIRAPLLEPIMGVPIPKEYPGDETIKAWSDQGQSVKEQLDAKQKALDEANKPKPEPKTREIETIENGVRVKKIVPDVAGGTYPVPDPTIPPGQAAAQAETARHNRVMEARPVGGGGSSSGMGNSDVEAIADGIISGEQPPTLTGLYRNAGPVRAALARKHYNLADATTDWQATQKHVSTLNGAQQTRMAQAIDNAAHSLDVIDDLASQWQGGKFPMLNKAQLAAAKQGAMGPQAQQIATKLEAQIADVTSELGNVYMGGNSPTDHALTLAAKNLSADWTQAQLKSAIELARKNLVIRQNSMRNVGVAGAGATNQYNQQNAQPQGVPPPTLRFNPATGKVEPIK